MRKIMLLKKDYYKQNKEPRLKKIRNYQKNIYYQKIYSIKIKQ